MNKLHISDAAGKPSLLADPGVTITHREDGAILLDSPMPLESHARCTGEYLEQWAAACPERDFLLERGADGAWRGVTYGQARDKVYRIATWLLRSKASPERPVAVLAGNSVEHGLLMLACLHAGIPYSALSTAYSLVSKDHAKLKLLIKRLDPGVIYVDDARRFAPALAAIEGLHDATVVTAEGNPPPPGGASFSSLLAEADEDLVASAFSQIGPDTVAKILFTSGSTSEPKGVINTQKMLCSNQQALGQLWPFLKETPPVLLDWLPWNHTFGSNHNFNLALRNGGTLYLDDGKPMPGAFDASIAKLREVRPTFYLNVPRGFEMLVPALRADAELRKAFFSRLQVIFYAAAALPQHLWDELIELSTREVGYPLPMVTGWGSTETAPSAAACCYLAKQSGVIGLPVPGVTLKLVPNGDKLEIRVKGPNIMPGYFRQPELTPDAFDDENFYIIGDAVRFADPSAPHLGLVFDGRVTENFKLSSGTWVHVASLRLKGIEACKPAVQDIVVAGHDREQAAFLIFPNMAACRQIAGLPADAPAAEVLRAPAVREHIRLGLRKLREEGGGSSTYAARALLLPEPPSVDGGEITDKGYINQAAVLKNRAGMVDCLYRAEPGADIIAP